MTKDFYTKEDLQKAKEVSALDYALSNNYPLKKTGKYYRHKEHDSMVFEESGKWHWNSQGLVNQSAIDLLIQYENKSYIEAIKILTGNSVTVLPYSSHKTSKKSEEEKIFHLPEKNDTHKRMFAYLTQTRILDFQLVKYLFEKGLIYESKNYHNVVFVQKDVEGNIKGAMLRGTNTHQYKQFKGLSEGTDKNSSLFYFGNTKSPKQIAVFEGAIDAISYATLLKNRNERDSYKSTLYLATGGNGRTSALKFIEKYQNHIEQVLLCQDHDEAGNELAKKLENDIKENLSINTKRELPDGKDFNEDLQLSFKSQDEELEL